MLRPKLLTVLQNYSVGQFYRDLTAGLVVGIVALPLAIAFGIASGVSPEKGLITAIVAGFIISVLGGSRVQIGGPTGAFVIIIYGIVQNYGVDGLIVATFMAGILLVVMGLARLGKLIEFIPHAVIVGFTGGIAVIIFSSQIKDFFGLDIQALPVEFMEKWRHIFLNLGSMNHEVLMVALITIAIIVACYKVSPKIPAYLLAIVGASVLVRVFHLRVETIGSRFGALPTKLPMPRPPTINFEIIQNLFHPAFTIAFLGAIESLLSAVVTDRMIGGKHRPNMELVAQGFGNIGSAFFGGIPATGAIARTVVNVKNGGRTPVAGMIHALVLLAILLFFGSWIQLVPLACLAGILVMVAYHMSGWRSFLEHLKNSKREAMVLLTVFLTTILVDLTAAIVLGVILSFLLKRLPK